MLNGKQQIHGCQDGQRIYTCLKVAGLQDG